MCGLFWTLITLQRQEKTSRISVPHHHLVWKHKLDVLHVLYGSGSWLLQRHTGKASCFLWGGWQRIDGQVISNRKTGSWKTSKQVSASLLQIKKKKKNQHNQQTKTKNQSTKIHQTSHHHPLPTSTNAHIVQNKLWFIQNPGHPETIMCKNKLTASVPMQELPTPSMHRRSKGGQGKRTQTSHRMSHHQRTCNRA